MKENSLKAPNASLAQGPRAPAPRREAPTRAELDRGHVLVAARRRDAELVEAVVPASLDAPRRPVEHRVAPPAYRPRRSHSTRRKVAAAILGVSLVGGGAFAATNWIVGLNAGSSGQGQSATVQNLTIAAVSSPGATNLLYPGGTGDVVLTITNPNPYPVTLTGVTLPTNTTYATGYTSAALTTTQTGCLATTPSYVIWNFSTSTSGSAHTFTTPITVGPSGNANNPLTVTMTNDASMTASTPAACANTFFSMPALTGIAASGGAASVTSTPFTDAWTS